MFIAAPSRPDVGFALLALQVVPERDFDSWTRDDADLFVRISTSAVDDWYSDHACDDTLLRLLVCMEKVARTSINHRWPECGSFTSMESTCIRQLYYLFHPSSYEDRAEAMRPLFPHALICAIDECREEALLTGDMDELDALVEESQRLLALPDGGTRGGDNNIAAFPSGAPTSSAKQPTVTQSGEPTSSALGPVDGTSHLSAATPEPASSDPIAAHTSDERTTEEHTVPADATSPSPLTSSPDAAVGLFSADSSQRASSGTRTEDIELHELARSRGNYSEQETTVRADHGAARFCDRPSAGGALHATRQPPATLNPAHTSDAEPASAPAIALEAGDAVCPTLDHFLNRC